MAGQQTRVGLRYAAASDIGMIAEANADSAYADHHLIAVADGTAGPRRQPHFLADHLWAPDYIDDRLGSPSASATIINALSPPPADVSAAGLVPALEHAVQRADQQLRESNPALSVMGTTLTAMLWSGSHVALVHIGDSRGYMLRDEALFQITHDHTVVQSLVDDGRITADEAATHPLRSRLSLALEGRGETEPDLSLREARLGDRYLLCTDGLTTVLSAETIWNTLTTIADPDEAVGRLIELANRGGGPDNITCVLADFVEVTYPQPPARPVLAGSVVTTGIAPQTPQHPSVPTRRLPPKHDRTEPAGLKADFTLDGYEVFESLGIGGNAVVYRGRRTALGREVAIKVVARRMADARDLRRFRREVDATVRLSEHPNVVTLYDADTLPDDRPYLVMELCPGGSLADRLRRDGPMDPAYVREVGIQVADAVAAAHDHGVLHRDIKPANLLVTRFGRVALADFGIAALPVPGQDMSVTLAMTPSYAAPEVFDDSKPSAAGDVYSLGATLYALLAGRAPRSPGRDLSPNALIAHVLRMRNAPIPPIPGVPTAFMAVLGRALEDNPSARFRTAADLRDTLRHM